MMKTFTLKSIVRNVVPLCKSMFLPMSFLAMSSVAQAQELFTKPLPKERTLYQMMNQHAVPDDYPKPKIPMATEKMRRVAHDALGEPLNFPERVWFPGEWEEVKAVVVTLPYAHLVPGHEEDERYYADPIVKGWANYIFKNEKLAKKETVGTGPYKTEIDFQHQFSKIFYYIIDAIQQGGAEAWVRIEASEDEEKVRNVLQDLGLRHDNLRFIVAPGNSLWFRDCGPICFYYGDEDELAMLDFNYGSSRPLDDLLPSVLHREMGIPNYKTDVLWEGGNCLVDGVGGLVTSTAVYRNNTTTEGYYIWDGKDFKTIRLTSREALTAAQVKTALSEMLGQRQTTVVPHLNYDGGTGHMDLYADAIDENSFLFAAMPEDYSLWSDYDIVEQNVSYLFNRPTFWGRKYYDMGRLPFPALDDGSYFASEEDYANYTRTYANHLIVNNVIVQPCFSPVGDDGMPTKAWDRANIMTLQKRYPGYSFYCIDMRQFDQSGGSIHCVTKQIPADNPVRILHKNIYGDVNPGTLEAIPFSAIITNKSGIQTAELVFRVNDGKWQTVSLTANGNRWSTAIDLDVFTEGQSLADGIPVEYYIKATSNNGKTITKPFCATYGSLYNFTLTNDKSYDADMFDFSTEPMDKNLITFPLGTNWLTEDTSTPPTVDISEVKKEKLENANGWYSLQGCHLDGFPSTKGVYIYNGRKVVIK